MNDTAEVFTFETGTLFAVKENQKIYVELCNDASFDYNSVHPSFLVPNAPMSGGLFSSRHPTAIVDDSIPFVYIATFVKEETMILYGSGVHDSGPVTVKVKEHRFLHPALGNFKLADYLIDSLIKY